MEKKVNLHARQTGGTPNKNHRDRLPLPHAGDGAANGEILRSRSFRSTMQDMLRVTLSRVKGKTGRRFNERILYGLLVFSLLLFLPAVKSFSSEEDSDQVPFSINTEEGTDTACFGVNASGIKNRVVRADPVRASEGYSTVIYDNTNGLPTSEANAITETRDGFIWIGSYSGLIRYDGNTFERLDSSTGIGSVVSLFVDSRDRLWIGTNDSGVAVMEQGKFRMWGKTEGLLSTYVCAIAEDLQGRIYVATTEGIAVIDEQMELHPFGDERVDNVYMSNLRIGNDGIIYGLTGDGDIFSIRDGVIECYLTHEEIGLDGIMCILPDVKKPGYLYLGTDTSIVYHGNFYNSFRVVSRKDVSPLVLTESMEYINDQIWVCAGNGIGVFSSKGFVRLKNMPMDNSIGHMMTDYEGNLWFTSTRQGVMKITPNQFLNLFERYKLPGTVVNTTCIYNNLLFIGTDSGMIVLDEKKETEVTALPINAAKTASGDPVEADDLLEFTKGGRIRSIILDSRGRLWISTWRHKGLLCFDGDDLTVYNVEDGLFSDRIRCVFERKDGSLLAVNTGGVCIIENDHVTKSFGEKDGIVNTSILTAVEGFNGEIILGSDGGGIYILDGSGCRHMGVEDGLSSEIIMRIKRDPLRDIYWIVTSNSISFMTADLQVSTRKNYKF